VMNIESYKFNKSKSVFSCHMIPVMKIVTNTTAHYDTHLTIKSTSVPVNEKNTIPKLIVSPGPRSLTGMHMTHGPTKYHPAHDTEQLDYLLHCS